MLKNSPSLVSIFIVFSLICLIQTILNSNILEYQEDSTSFDLRVLSLRQVVVDAARWNPESENLYINDRIVFISIGDFLFRNILFRNINYKSVDLHPIIVSSRNLYNYKFSYFSQTELSKSTIQLRSKIDKDGNCVSIDDMTDGQVELDDYTVFSNRIRQKYGIDASKILTTSYLDYVFSWQQSGISNGIKIVIGMSMAYYPDDERHLRSHMVEIEPEWGLKNQIRTLDYPFPIIEKNKVVEDRKFQSNEKIHYYDLHHYDNLNRHVKDIEIYFINDNCEHFQINDYITDNDYTELFHTYSPGYASTLSLLSIPVSDL